MKDKIDFKNIEEEYKDFYGKHGKVIHEIREKYNLELVYEFHLCRVMMFLSLPDKAKEYVSQYVDEIPVIENQRKIIKKLSALYTIGMDDEIKESLGLSHSDISNKIKSLRDKLHEKKYNMVYSLGLRRRLKPMFQDFKTDNIDPAIQNKFLDDMYLALKDIVDYKNHVNSTIYKHPHEYYNQLRKRYLETTDLVTL